MGNKKAELKSYKQLSFITAKRKAIVDKLLLLPIADFKSLVETETAKPKAKSKTEKKKTKKKKKIVELDYAVNKSNDAIKKNVIRTTANNIFLPICFFS